MIRMAEAGIRPPNQAEDNATPTTATAEKKSKKDKDKNVRMVYSEADVSPEEKLAMLPRYRFAIEA
ncbi:hypothetical protein B0T17DRAFT_528488 [Bombardia bombarda]|uniref:Uncharacterized protein n=1 Tax=Bombardia bombarda TaxID=252184 RepID=A0AA39XAQ1_9PEZI|nr:hypothetical protein B0T17DRAFT_528488 [Bombardia bombarda]